MKYAMVGIGVIAAAALMAAAGWMNWRFMTSLATTPEDRLALGAASIGIDLMKGVLAYLIALGWDRRQWAHVAIGSVFYLLLAAFSLSSALGFAAETRDAVLSERAELALRHQAARRELAEIGEQLDRLGKMRAPAVVEAELALLGAERRWTITKGCTIVRGPDNAGYCKRYGEKKVELASARVAETLETRRKELRDLETQLGGKGALRAIDGQARLGAWWSRLPEETVRNLILCLLAIVMEIGAGQSLFLATRPIAEARQPRAAQDHKIPIASLKVEPQEAVDTAEPASGENATAMVGEGQPPSALRQARPNGKAAKEPRRRRPRAGRADA